MSDKNNNAWIIRYNQSVDFQRSAQMTWWSILQGLAVAALAERIFEIVEMNADYKWTYLLLAVTSMLILVSSWVQMSWAIMMLHWPVNVTHTAFTLLLGVMSYLMALYIDQPANWFHAVLGVVISALIIYIYNLVIGAVVDVTYKVTLRTIAVYLFVALVCLIAIWQIKRSPTPTTQLLWSSAIFTLAVIDWVLQSRNIKAQSNAIEYS